MWGMIFGFLNNALGLKDVVRDITKSISEQKIALINAGTEKERIQVQQNIAELEAQRDVLVAEGRTSNANIYMRIGLALPVCVVLWKIFVWDKAFGQWTGGHTDALGEDLWWTIRIVLGFYFLFEVTKIWKRGA